MAHPILHQLQNATRTTKNPSTGTRHRRFRNTYNYVWKNFEEHHNRPVNLRHLKLREKKTAELNPKSGPFETQLCLFRSILFIFLQG